MDDSGHYYSAQQPLFVGISCISVTAHKTPARWGRMSAVWRLWGFQCQGAYRRQ